MTCEQLADQIIDLIGDWKRSHASKMKESEWNDLARIKIWAIALNDLQITGTEFLTAKRKSVSQLWLPSSPADFLALARQPIADNYPDSDIAYIAAANGNYLHAVCHETAQRIGTFELRTQDGYITSKKWNRIYKEVCIEHSQNAAKFNQNIAAIERKRQSDKHVLAAPKMSLETQSAITQSAIDKIRKLL